MPVLLLKEVTNGQQTGLWQEGALLWLIMKVFTLHNFSTYSYTGTFIIIHSCVYLIIDQEGGVNYS